MTIYRHKNKKLYTLEMVRRRMYTEGPQLVAFPYKHNVEILKPRILDFVVVSEK
jgi:hypothetical protein